MATRVIVVQYNNNIYLALVTLMASCSDSILILIFLHRILTGLAVLYLVLYIYNLYAPITRLLRLFCIVLFEVHQYCSSSTGVLTVARHI